jgi:hypothetical protein
VRFAADQAGLPHGPVRMCGRCAQSRARPPGLIAVIHLVPGNDYHYCAEMEQAYRLRHQVFIKEMGWHNLASRTGARSINSTTSMPCIYIEHGEVLGYQRLLSTTRQHLLSDIMPELCEVERPIGSDIWEISRHASRRAIGPADPASPIANALGSGLPTAAAETGGWNGIRTNTRPDRPARRQPRPHAARDAPHAPGKIGRSLGSDLSTGPKIRKRHE